MDFKKFIESYSNSSPVGFGGCRNNHNNFDCCEFNLTIFDKKDLKESVIEHDGNLIVINHLDLKESNSCALVKLDGMKVLQDEQWELQMLLSKISQNKAKLYKDCARNNILESIFCTVKANDSMSSPYGSIWHKCSILFLADGICLLNNIKPSPTHTLEKVRSLEKNRINEKFSLVVDSLGFERATPVLLERMFKSTIGFSEIIRGTGYSKVIKVKYDYLTKNSLFSDCYFYLSYINRDNFMKIKNEIHKKPEYFHILKIAFDTEGNDSKMAQQTGLIKKTANELLASLSV